MISVLYRKTFCIKCVVYYTVSHSPTRATWLSAWLQGYLSGGDWLLPSWMRPVPLGLWDSLNGFTIFAQPPYSFASCLANIRLWLFTLYPRATHTQRLSIAIYCHRNSPQAGFKPSSPQLLPVGSRHVTTKLIRLVPLNNYSHMLFIVCS